MRALRHETVVEPFHADIDECVGDTSVSWTIVAHARALGQRLQRSAHSGAADLVEVAADVDRAVVAARQLEAACLHALCFFVGATLGVGRMASVVAVVMKASDGVLAS